MELVDALCLHGVLRAPVGLDEIGFPGPAYPRGYKNPGIDAREPFEVRDVKPSEDPVRGDGTR